MSDRTYKTRGQKAENLPPESNNHIEASVNLILWKRYGSDMARSEVDVEAKLITEHRSSSVRTVQVSSTGSGKFPGIAKLVENSDWQF